MIGKGCTYFSFTDHNQEYWLASENLKVFLSHIQEQLEIRVNNLFLMRGRFMVWNPISLAELGNTLGIMH